MEGTVLIVEAELPPGTSGTLLLPDKAGSGGAGSETKKRILLPAGRTEIRIPLANEP